MSANSSLTVSLPRDRWWVAAVSAWALLAAAAVFGWWLSMRQQDAAPWQGLLPLLAAAHAAWLLRREWRSPAAVLRWDGQSWLLERGQGEQACSVEVALDVDRWMLLCLSPADPPRGGSAAPVLAWHAVAAGSQPPGKWHALRCALMQHAGQRAATSAASPTEGAA